MVALENEIELLCKGLSFTPVPSIDVPELEKDVWELRESLGLRSISVMTTLKTTP